MRKAFRAAWVLASLLCLAGGLWQSIDLSAHEGHWKAPESAKALKNPVEVNPKSLASGKELYGKYCAMCHGDQGKGDGAMAATLPEVPADLSAVLGKETDGELFWKLSTGRNPMPPFEKKMSKEEMWTAVNYIKTFIPAGKKQ